MTPEQIRVKEFMETAGYTLHEDGDYWKGIKWIDAETATFFYRLTLSARRDEAWACDNLILNTGPFASRTIKKRIAAIDQLLKETGKEDAE